MRVPDSAFGSGAPPHRTSVTETSPRDLDQIKADINSPKHLEQHKSTKAPEDLPGLGQYYCVECAKWFESEHSMVTHRKGSTHKRQ